MWLNQTCVHAQLLNNPICYRNEMYGYEQRRRDCNECDFGSAIHVPAVACASERVYVLVKNAPKSHGAKCDVPTRAVSPKLSNA